MGCDGSNGLKPKTWPCCLCGKKISDSLKTVKNHALRAHIRPLRCKLCGMPFGKAFELNRHNGHGACKGIKNPQSSDPGPHTMALAKMIKDCKKKDQIVKTLLDADRGHLHGCDKLLLKADREHLGDYKHIDVDSDQDGHYELDLEYMEHTEAHISNGPPPGEMLQTGTWDLGSGYGDNIMGVVPAGEFDRVLGHIPPNLEFEILIRNFYIDQERWHGGHIIEESANFYGRPIV